MIKKNKLIKILLLILSIFSFSAKSFQIFNYNEKNINSLNTSSPNSNVRTLSTPREDDISTTKDSVEITTIVNNEEGTETLEKYKLYIKDNSGNIVGTQDPLEMNSEGFKTININDLDHGVLYSDCFVVATNLNDEEITRSLSFDFYTQGDEILSISTPESSEISTNKTTAAIPTIVRAQPGEEGSVVDDYYLKVMNGNESLGETEKLSSDGEQIINLSGLEENTNYNSCRIIALRNIDDLTSEIVSSNNFSFTTSVGNVSSLTTPTPDDIELTSKTANITTIVTASLTENISSSNYYLIIKNNLNVILGKTEVLNSIGEQSIFLEGLKPETRYENLTIYANEKDDGSGIDYAHSKTFGFTTYKKEIDKITTPTSKDIITTKTTADITTTTSIFNSNKETNDYYLEVVDSRGQRLGITDKLNSDGEQIISLKNLTVGTEYKDCKINSLRDLGGKNVITSSEIFTFKTSLEPVTELNNPRVVSTTKNSAKISVDVVGESSLSKNKTLDEYSLEIIGEDDNVVGESDATNLNKSGNVKFTVSNLKAATTYNVRIQLVDNPNIFSEKFSIDTQRPLINKISNGTLISKTYKSAKISVDVSSGDDNENCKDSLVKKYSLLVEDKNTHSKWSLDNLNTDGTKIIDIDNLYQNTKYNLTVTVVETGMEGIETDIDEFTTNNYPVTPNPNSLELFSPTKDSFKFSMVISFDEDVELDPKKDIIFYSDNNQLDIDYLSTSRIDYETSFENKYTFIVQGLKSKHTYKNFSVKITGFQDPIKLFDSDGNAMSITTKINSVVIGEIVASSAILIIILIIVGFIFWEIRKKVMKDRFNEGIKYG